MSDIINNFINNINVDEELKKMQADVAAQESNNAEQLTQAKMSNMDVVADTAASAATGVAKGLTYVIDLPFFLVQGIESGKNFVLDKTAEAMGFTKDETDQIKSDVEIGIENSIKFKPGEYIRDNFLTYESKSKLGDYAMTIGEYAAPGGLLGKTQKARNLFMGTGAASGAVDQAVTNQFGDATGTITGVGTNLALDLFALKKGNLAVLTKDMMPSQAQVEKAKKLETDIKKIDKDFDLLPSEKTGSNIVKTSEGQVTATIAGNKVMDKYWSERPEKLRSFIQKWGEQNGIIIGSRRFVSDKEYYKQLKKAAVALQTQRSKEWLRSGGDKLQNFFYDSQKVDNLVINFKNLAKGLEPSDAKTILQFAKNLQKTKGNGQAMHNVYREIRDTYFNIVGRGTKASEVTAVKKYKQMKESLNNLMSSNADYVKAQKAYIKYNDEYAKPITKGSITELFKSLEKARSAEDIGTIAKMWKFLDTKAAPQDISDMAKAINKSGVPDLWQNIVTGYIDQAFLKSQAKHIDNGLSQGVIFHDAIMKDPKQKANLTQMLFELTKTKDPNVKLKDVKEAVNSFANIMKATAQGGKVGSSTAGNLQYQAQASKSSADLVEGLPIRNWFVQWSKDRTLSKNSKIIAEAMTSDRGIDAFLELTQDWKDYNSALALLRAVTVGANQDN
tara:strand:+ start:1177 stop:3195 length:2019 start_codon:yes stop_codon:yes gene_type:complete